MSYGKRPRMKWYLKLCVFIVVAVLVVYIGAMVYMVKAKYEMNGYSVALGNAFNAAMLVNAQESFTDAERAVIAEYDGRESVVAPENYKALLTCLRMEHAMPLLGRVDREEALRITICGADTLYIEGDSDGQGALIRFESGEDRYLMHINGTDIWEKLLKLCIEGSYKAQNLVPEI